MEKARSVDGTQIAYDRSGAGPERRYQDHNRLPGASWAPQAASWARGGLPDRLPGSRPHQDRRVAFAYPRSPGYGAGMAHLGALGAGYAGCAPIDRVPISR